MKKFSTGNVDSLRVLAKNDKEKIKKVVKKITPLSNEEPGLENPCLFGKRNENFNKFNV